MKYNFKIVRTCGTVENTVLTGTYITNDIMPTGVLLPGDWDYLSMTSKKRIKAMFLNLQLPMTFNVITINYVRD